MRRRAFCASLLAIGCGNDMLGFSSLGSGAPIGIGFAPALPIPLGPTAWDSYWDLSALTGQTGKGLSSTISSLVGSSQLTPVTLPVPVDHALGGKRGIQLDGATQYLRCDAASAVATGSDAQFSVFVRFMRAGTTGSQTLFSFGSSSGASDNFVIVRLSSTGILQILKDAASESTVTRSSTTAIDFDEHTLLVTFAGTTVAAYLDGSALTLDSSALDTLAISVNRFAVGATFNSAASDYLNGYVSLVGVTSQNLAAQAATLHAAAVSTDYTLSKSASPKFVSGGDSIMEFSTDPAFVGFRGRRSQYFWLNRMSMDAIGQFQSGNFMDRSHSALSGSGLNTIVPRIQADVTAETACIFFEGNVNELVNSGKTAAQVASDYTTALNSVRATHATAPIVVYTCPAIQTGTAGSDQVTTLNGLLTGIWDAHDAAHPTLLLRRVDLYAACGGAWNSTYYANNIHPNAAGHQKIHEYEVAACRATWRSISATLAPLECGIVSPTAASPIVENDVINVTGTMSRSDATVVVKLDGATLGTATTNGLTWSFGWTVVNSQIGSRTLTAVVTDAVSGTATSSPVSLTITADAYSPADEGNLILDVDMTDSTSFTVTGADVTDLINRVSLVHAAEATAPPAYEAAGGPGGVPCMTFDKTSSEKLLSGTDAAYGAALSGTDKSYTRFFVCKLTALNDTTLLYGAWNSGSANRGIFVGQVATNKWWIGRTSDASATTDIRTLSTASGWGILEIHFDGTTRTQYARWNAGTEVSAVLASATMTGLNRWSFGCRGDNVPDSFGAWSVTAAFEFGAHLDAAASTRVYNYLVTKFSGLGLSSR